MSILELTATFGQSANEIPYFAALLGSTKISAQLVQRCRFSATSRVCQPSG
jgi:hypothetical protein